MAHKGSWAGWWSDSYYESYVVDAHVMGGYASGYYDVYTVGTKRGEAVTVSASA